MLRSTPWAALLALVILTQFLVSAPAAEPRFEPKWDSLDKRPCPPWFRDAKFGIFIHWGVYSVPAWGKTGEYAEWYWNRIHDKKPDNVWWQFHKKNYGEYVRLPGLRPASSGRNCSTPTSGPTSSPAPARKYIVPTSKHHEGFCLWPSAEASRDWGRPWNAVEIGPHARPLGRAGRRRRASAG